MIKVLINGINGRMGQEVLKQVNESEEFKVCCGIDKFNNNELYAKYGEVVSVLPFEYFVNEYGEDKEILLNPISETSLNESEVCVTFDSEKAMERKLIAYIFGEQNLYD
mgnify:CR=1 FL=1